MYKPERRVSYLEGGWGDLENHFSEFATRGSRKLSPEARMWVRCVHTMLGLAHTDAVGVYVHVWAYVYVCVRMCAWYADITRRGLTTPIYRGRAISESGE